jgi:hypothetical protein
MTDNSEETQKERYAKTWGTEIGQDCITLKASLARWLGPRLVFLAQHTTSLSPGLYKNREEHLLVTKRYLDIMAQHGNALIEFGKEEENASEATEAMLWVAENFIHLWD